MTDDYENMSYEVQLSRKEWRIKRLEVLERDNKICQGCGKDRPKLHGLIGSFKPTSIKELMVGDYVLVKEISEINDYKDLMFRKSDNIYAANYLYNMPRSLKLEDLVFALQKKETIIFSQLKTTVSLVCFYNNDITPSMTIDLNIHHKYYIKKKMAWEYKNEALITLCMACHQKEHLENKIPVLAENGDLLYLTKHCGRCSGSGYLEHYNYFQGGVCFACHGEGIILDESFSQS